MAKKYNYANMFLRIMDDLGVEYERKTVKDCEIISITSFHALTVISSYRFVLRPHFYINKDGSFLLRGRCFEDTLIDDFEKLRKIVFYEWKETLYSLAGNYFEELESVTNE